MSGGGKGKQTVGYKYYMGLLMGWCHGPIDALLELRAGDRTTWKGSQTSSGQLSIDKPKLFGGDEKEGGIVGALDVQFGEDTQAPNSYLASKIGAGRPAYRGIFSTVYRGGQIASNNPYVKPWSAKIRRITKGWANDAPWYPAKAPVVLFAGTPAFVQNVNLGGGTNAGTSSAVGVTVSGFSASDTVVVTFPSGGSYSGWSPYASDPESPTPWRNTVRVTTSGGTTAYRPAGYTTAAAALAAAQADGPIYLSGYTSYTFWIYDTPTSDNRGGISLRVSKATTPGMQAMNPAHIVYQCLTDPSWGMGYDASIIDEASFTYAADTFYSEGLGLCIQWARQDSIENFIKLVLDHAGAVCVEDRQTGLIKLVPIRGDYDITAVPDFSDSAGNIVDVESIERASISDSINEVNVSYIDSATGKEGSVTVQNLAAVQAAGRAITQSHDYPGLPTIDLALKLAMRDLRAVSSGLARVKMTVNREGYSLVPGSVIAFAWSRADITQMALRVISADYGSLTDGRVRLECVEDVFGMPETTYVVTEDGGWVDPNADPVAAAAEMAFEVPYRDLVQQLTASDLSSLPTDAGYIATAAVRGQQSDQYYGLYTRVSPADYESAGTGSFCASGTLSGSLAISATTATLSAGVDLADVEVGTAAFIGTGVSAEMVRVDAIDATTGAITIGRGCGDTVPKAWAGGTRVYFYDAASASSSTQYADGEAVNAKVAPSGASSELDLSGAAELTVTMDSRAARPYPPGKIRINSAVPGSAVSQTFTLSWQHRDRKLQSDQLIDHEASSVGPEQNTRYKVRVINDGTNALILEQADMSGMSCTILLAADYAAIRLEVYCIRDGFESWQRNVTTPFAYTRGAAGDAYVISNPGSPGQVTHTAAPADVPVNTTPQDAYDNSTGTSTGAIQSGSSVFAVAGGTANAITATFTPTPTLTDGMELRVRASGANSITNPTFNPNGLGALTIYKLGGQALLAGDIFGAGHEITLRYRASPARWELLSPAASGSGGASNSAVMARISIGF